MAAGGADGLARLGVPEAILLGLGHRQKESSVRAEANVFEGGIVKHWRGARLPCCGVPDSRSPVLARCRKPGTVLAESGMKNQIVLRDWRANILASGRVQNAHLAFLSKRG